MNEANDILTLLGIPSERIKFCMCESCEENSKIYIELFDAKGLCPHCGSSSIEVKGYYKVNINNSLIKHKKMVVEINVRRYRCKKCSKTFKQDYNFYENGDRISIPLKVTILDDLKERLTFTQIAKDHQMSINKVRDIFDRYILPQLALPLTEIICIDEFCFKHSKSDYGKYPAVITDPMSGKILDIIESRWKNILIDYFNRIKIPIRRNVKYLFLI